MYENYIKVNIEIDITNVKPYYLKFDYIGDSLFKERLLNLAKDGEYVLTVEKRLFKKSYYYRWRKYPSLSRRLWWPSMQDLFNDEKKISFLLYENKNEVEAACLEIQKLLNEFIDKEWKIYNGLVLELQQKNLAKEKE